MLDPTKWMDERNHLDELKAIARNEVPKMVAEILRQAEAVKMLGIEIKGDEMGIDFTRKDGLKRTPEEECHVKVINYCVKRYVQGKLGIFPEIDAILN